MIILRHFARLTFSICLISFIITSSSNAEKDKKIRISEKPAFKYEVIEEKVNDYDDRDVQYFVIKKYKEGKIDNTFSKVECFASDIQGYTGKCNAITLLDGKLLLADCFTHNSIAYSCRLVRYNQDGFHDTDFNTPFTSSQSDIVNGTPKHEIKNIKQVGIETNETIRIEGEFISPLVGWSSEQARSEIGDSAGRNGIVHLSRDGAFISFVPKARD